MTRRQERARWILGGLALLVVVVVGVTALLVTRSDPAPTPPTAAPTPPANPPVDTAAIASADDKGPVRFITEDPTCTDWGSINGTLAATQRNGWDRRDATVPAREWTTEQQGQYAAVAKAMLVAADETVELAKLTPHRVMRELYEQSIAYWRAYADAVPRYQPGDDYLALTAASAAGAIVSICDALDFGAAAGRSPIVLPGSPPAQLPPLGDPARPTRFISAPSPFCAEWTSMVSRFDEETKDWRDRADPNVPAVGWSPGQRRLYNDVVPAMQRNADRSQLLGLISGNVVAADFAALSAQYRRAFIGAIPTYGPSDAYLNTAASRLLSVTDRACRSAAN
ncbi:hypothetical protein C6A85_000000113925 [Mycobacterium sp. ITM-2017-0098]|nr:hypothetical protein C6A85_000000113925 [Mycobacterium sp. ITM-2017-0098]